MTEEAVLPPTPKIVFKDIKTSLPMTPMDMVEFYKDAAAGDTVIYTVDVDACMSVLPNAAALLRYIANLKLPCLLDKITPEILTQYMNLNLEFAIPNLQLAHVNALYLFKFGELLYTHDEAFPLDGYEQFIKDNQATLIRQCQFLDSMLLYILANRSAPGEELTGAIKSTLEKTNARKSMIDEYVDQYRLVDEGLYADICIPLLQLLQDDNFVMAWYIDTMPFDQQIWFKRHFTEYMYAGKPLFAYVQTSFLLTMLSTPLNEGPMHDMLKAAIAFIEEQDRALT